MEVNKWQNVNICINTDAKIVCSENFSKNMAKRKDGMFTVQSLAKFTNGIYANTKENKIEMNIWQINRMTLQFPIR
jgi:hypothetical protein